MPKPNTIYDLCRVYERWRREKGVAECAVTTIRFLMANGLLDEGKMRMFASRELFLDKIRKIGEEG